MNAYRAVGAAFFTGLAVAAPLAAQGPGAADTLLTRITAEALGGNPELAGLAARARAAEARVRPAGALPDPGLSFTLMDLTLPRFRFRESDFTEVDVEARQEFPWPGTQAARSRAAAASSEERRADLAAGRREIILSTADLYYRLRAVIAAREILGRQETLLGSAVEIATARYASGSAPQSDPLFARVARARLGTEQAAFRGEETGLRARLAALRGKTEAESLAVAPLRPEDILALYPAPAAHPPATSGSLDQHPLLLARRSAIASAEATARAEALGSRPDVAVMVRYGMRPIASDFFSAGVGLRLPLWAGRKQKLQAEAARLDAEAERSALANERARLGAELAATLAQAEASLARLRLLLQAVMPAAEAGHEAALRSYRVGQTEFQAVLTAQESLYRVRLEAVVVAADHLTTRTRLEQLTREEEDR